MKARFERGVTRLLLTGLLVFCSIICFPQTTKIFGVKAGLNSSRIEGVPSNELKNNFTGGVFMEWHFGDHVGLSTDLIYSGKGAEREVVKNYGEASDVSNSVTLHYLEAPVLLNYLFTSPESTIRPKVVFGPSFAYLTGGTSTGSYNSNFDDWDFGLVAGGGLNFKLSDMSWLNLDARYTYGLYEIAAGDISNRNLGITLGVGFDLGGY